MTRTNETKIDRALAELELNTVTGGTIRKPNNINKPPLIPPTGAGPEIIRIKIA